MRRIERAQQVYTEAINALESRDLTSLSPLEQLLVRNNYFYRGDCAFAMEHYAQAINWYDQAAKRWEQHPAALVALMQIVNCYSALGQREDAKVAMSRAQYTFNRMTPDVFDDPSLPISRKHWEDWFQWTGELNLYHQAKVSSKP